MNFKKNGLNLGSTKLCRMTAAKIERPKPNPKAIKGSIL
jgi:hypothetical protein